MRLVTIWALILSFSWPAQSISVDSWRHVDDKTRGIMLSIARRAFESYVVHRTTLDPPSGLPELLRQRSGVFVSAMHNGAPRCCMGSVYPTEVNTAVEIIASAVAAAGHDHRFPPIKPGELRGLNLIVSIVGQPHPIDAQTLADIDPTRDGVAIKFGDRYGVTLSGETNDVARMVKWARMRAGAGPGSVIQLYRLEDVRFVEKPHDTP